MIKKYNITVNGCAYQVEVEEVKEFTEAVQPVVQKTVAAPATQKVVEPVKETSVKEAPKAVAGGEKIECPMPGTILKVNISEGQTIKKGDVLFVLEAMKMENEIMSPVDGKVAQVAVQKGAAVNTSDLLAVIE
ncbi:biotin/lipoyl-containing protein [Clostridium hydrogeniformans]|uniref:biotin/lipoyl-containing protein n=1 Tax=Clostridium hydrogeniformans TaxID=349933 RepID=UPI000AF12D7A